jgi:serine/threonine-protein kinase HipA
VDIKARVLATNIDLDEATCSLDLLLGAADLFGVRLAEAKAIVREVANVTRTWREVARETGSREGEVQRMSSAFEHDDLDRALKLS